MDVIESRARVGTTRRLAAIMAADVAGYSRLIGEDETGTLQRMQARRVEMDSCIAQHNGRIANTAGDSVLAEFASVVDAVACALAVQRIHAGANAQISTSQQVRFRIGVHIGDIVVRDGDLFGDGVNIAARLQALAEPGGIVLSGKVRDEVRGRFDVDLLDGGVEFLKNIREPVHIWRIGPDAPSGAQTLARTTWLRFVTQRRDRRVRVIAALGAVTAAGSITLGVMRWQAGGNDMPTFAVEHFAAVGDTDVAPPLADALTDRLAGGIGGMPYLRLIRPSAADSSATRADYAIAGNVAVTNGAAHVDARIVETDGGRVVASTSFDTPRSEPAQMEQEILGAIGDDLSVELNRLRYPAPPPTDATRHARELAQQARLLVDSRRDPVRAIDLFEQASRLSPADADIAGWYANNLIAIATSDAVDPQQRAGYFRQAGALIEREGRSRPFHRLFAYAKCQLQNYDGEASLAVEVCDRTRAILPWSARVYKEIGSAYLKLGVLDRALQSFRQAENLDRRHIVRWIWEAKAGITALLAGDNRGAAEWMDKAAALRGNDVVIQALLAVAFKRLGNDAGFAHQMPVVLGLVERDSYPRSVDVFLAPYRFANPVLDTRMAGLRADLVSLPSASR